MLFFFLLDNRFIDTTISYLSKNVRFYRLFNYIITLVIIQTIYFALPLRHDALIAFILIFLTKGVSKKILTICFLVTIHLSSMRSLFLKSLKYQRELLKYECYCLSHSWPCFDFRCGKKI
jgi:hypothetical protein